MIGAIADRLLSKLLSCEGSVVSKRRTNQVAIDICRTLLFSACLVLPGCGQSSDREVADPEPDYEQGTFVGSPACAGCHNPQGNGNAPAGYPALGGQNAEYLVKQLKAYRDGDRNNGANAAIMMDVAAKLTDAEIEAVSSYISGLN